MNAPAGVAIAAVVLGLMSFVGLLIAAASIIAQFVMNTPLIPHIPAVRMVSAGIDAFVIALVILAVCTIIGLFRLKAWARYSVLFLGLLDLLAFSFMAIGFLIARVKWWMAPLSLPNNPHLKVGDILLWLAIFYGILALIGVWWMIYFNAKSVRESFANAQLRLTP